MDHSLYTVQTFIIICITRITPLPTEKKCEYNALQRMHLRTRGQRFNLGIYLHVGIVIFHISPRLIGSHVVCLLSFIFSFFFSLYRSRSYCKLQLFPMPRRRFCEQNHCTIEIAYRNVYTKARGYLYKRCDNLQ